jgi:hypothetical protein
MSPDEQVVQRFYEAFKSSDAAGMAECYGEDATFQDIAFKLTGKPNIVAMWRFVCHRRPRIWFGCIRTVDPEVKAHWVADYKFQGTNQVNYGSDSRFTIRDGLIQHHHDEASRWNWARQALGIPAAILVTAFPFVLRIKANMELKKFLEEEKTAGRG